MLGLVESEETEEAQKSPADKPTVRTDRKNDRSSKPAEESKPRWNPQVESATPASSPALPARTQPAISNEQEASGTKTKVVITQPMVLMMHVRLLRMSLTEKQWLLILKEPMVKQPSELLIS